jgi:hypothetical protein
LLGPLLDDSVFRSVDVIAFMLREAFLLANEVN